MVDLTSIPVDAFVAQAFGTERVARIVAGWRVDSMAMQKICVKHVREMGIFTVPHDHRELVMKAILSHLANSPDIRALVQKAEAEEKKRQQNRHST